MIPPRWTACAVLVLTASMVVGQGDNKSQEPNQGIRPLPEAICAAWEKQGFVSGSSRKPLVGPVREVRDFDGSESVDLPAFAWFESKPGVLPQLPKPDQPFALIIYRAGQMPAEIFQELTAFKCLHTLELYPSITDSSLKGVSALSQIRKLRLSQGFDSSQPVFYPPPENLRRNRLTDGDVKQLVMLGQLETLDLSGIKVTDAHLKELSALQRLSALSLAGTSVTDSGVKELASFKRLKILDLSDTAITDEAVHEMTSLSELEVLSLERTRVTNTGAA